MTGKPVVEVRRSRRRQRTVSAYRDGERVVVLIPDQFSRAEGYLTEFALAPVSVRWVSNQHSRWGSCTPEDGTIRISERVRAMPEWVLDYVVLHELVHLVVPTHGSRFWKLVGRYPKAERARGYLEGVAAATA
jgi:predicted metal-dependent hydrolase